MDHLIHALVKDMLPTYEDCHKWQMLGMQGPNLAEKCRKEILACAPETPLEQIKEINKSRFEVQSTSFKKIYGVNLLSYTICAHAAISPISYCASTSQWLCTFFGGGTGTELRPQAPDNGTSKAELDKASHQPSRTVMPAKQNPCLYHFHHQQYRFLSVGNFINSTSQPENC